MILYSFLLVLGLVLLLKGADWFVDGASAMAQRFHISNLAIGLTVVAFGTSAPELVVNTFAAYESHHDIVLGNIIGSNIFNLFMILGIAGIISPLRVQSSTVWREIPLSFIAVVLLYVLANGFFFTGENSISRIDGLIFIFMFAVFLFYVYKQLHVDVAPQEESATNFSGLKITILVVLGLAGLVVGGRLVVSNAVQIATLMGVSEKIISLTIIAAGTSLPELATSVVAAIKKNNDIAVGNIIGSNIFNIFLVLGVSSLVRPIGFDTIFNFDIFFLAGGTVFLFLCMFSINKKRLDRWEAAILMLAFILYTAYLIGKEI